MGRKQRWVGYAPLQNGEATDAPIAPDPPPTEVRLAPEYSLPEGFVPLWPSSEATDALVSPDLIKRLLAWQEDFAANYDFDFGWGSDAARERWATTSLGLEADIRDALAGKVDLVVDLWPLGEKERHYPKESFRS
jgi:hypothetical protein